MGYKISVIFLFVFLGAVMALLLNLLLIEQLIIPDLCYYHSHPTTALFDVFYNFPPGEGGHPAPTLFNLIITLLLGGLMGFMLAKRKLKKKV